MEGGGVGESSAVPESVMESVNRTLDSIEEVQDHLLPSLSLFEPDVLALMQPLQRAQALLLLAKATSTILAVRLRCSGVRPDEHPVMSELERLSLYQEKLERSMDLSAAPLRPSTTLNYQAANRFIEHALPDLTAEQKQSMRDIRNREGQRTKDLESKCQKKRKYQYSDKPSVQTAVKEFLEKSAFELLGNNRGGLPGPVVIELSDDDEGDDDLLME